jgi:GWxTD domain-containing protein
MSIARNLVFFAVVASLFFACTGPSNMQTGSYRYLYDYESRELHPEYVLYHDSDDSSRIFFRIHSSELLYSRAGSASPFQAKIKLTASLSDKAGSVMDTVSIKISDPMRDQAGWLIGSFKIRVPTGYWNLLLSINDLSKGTEQTSFLRIDKTTSFSPQNYLLVNYETGEPVFTGFITPGQMVEVFSSRNADLKTEKLLRLSNELKLPPPPFSPNQPELPTLQAAVIQNVKNQSPGHWSFVVAGGNYFFTHDELMKSGLTIKAAGTFYPEVRMVSDMEWPIRYITTKTEHEDILKNNYPKKMIDQFWIECAGSKDQARELIRIYYSRVEEANLYFGSFTEGWRTDRGMIHLIFGNPGKITRFESTEIWQYGEEGTPGMLQFVFRKIESPFSNNVYTLDRDPNFRPYWEKMVQTWRSGRIYGE